MARGMGEWRGTCPRRKAKKESISFRNCRHTLNDWPHCLSRSRALVIQCQQLPGTPDASLPVLMRM